MPRKTSVILASSALWTALLATPVIAGERASELLTQAQQIFGVLPNNMATPEFPVTAERVELRRKLFFDPRMSADGTVSCSRCHLPALYGTDGLTKPHGVHNRVNPRNAPTVLNAALQFKAHWRGDRINVEDQAQQALIGPPSFGNEGYGEAMAKLKAIPGYAQLFASAFPGEQNSITPGKLGQSYWRF